LKKESPGTYETCRDVAIEAARLGLSVVPPREDRSKAPMVSWKRYQEIPADIDRVKQWYSVDRHGVGLVTGRVSRNLEVIEFEDLEIYTRFKECAHELGLDSLIERIETGYLERSPSGGFHWLYFTEDHPTGNTKLAQSINDSGERKTRIETRGEGGYIIIAPSHGPVHPLG